MMSSTIINQKEYLKRYLGIGKLPGDKKKKKKKDNADTRFKIIDDDLDLAMSREIQEDISASNEDAPQIVAVIDERPPSLRIDENTKNKLWKPIGEATEGSSDKGLKINSFQLKKTKGLDSFAPLINKKIKSETDSKRLIKEFSESKNRVKNEDFSPQRDQKPYKYDYSPDDRSAKKNSSPPRKKVKDEFSRERSYEDFSPSTIKTEVDLSASRKSNKDLSPAKKRDYSPDTKRNRNLTPPRNSSKDLSPVRKRSYSADRNRDEDLSPPRKRNKDDDSSPPRKDSKASFSKKCYDPSPSKNISKEIKLEKSDSPPRKHDLDLSPPRKGKHRDDFSKKIKREKSESPHRDREKDLSPPRRNKKRNVSPPRRREKREHSKSPPRQKLSRWSNRSPDRKRSGTPERTEKTLSGKKAGLQSAKDLAKEMMSLKEKEEEVFKKMSEDVSGKNAATVVRGQKLVDPEEEIKKLKKEKEMKEKYDRWGKGLKQVQDENEKMLEQLNEMNKPLARYADDEDLERYLKEQEREGDPMLDYIRKKKKKKSVEAGIPEKPMYMGEFLPNRFGIPPGYRWDGVDRSNGYEKKWFETYNAKKAVQEEAFKWSTEDM